ncbi:MAG: glycosyltransferase [Candidatus Babeliales bacterium]
MKKTILYLRTDIMDNELIAGGSVSHTKGVIQGFAKLGYSIVCSSSCMLTILQSLKEVSYLQQLKNPNWLLFLRWKINCFLSNIFFTYQTLQVFKKYKIDFIYQRYSVLNCSGILISTIKKIPLILEYNGSETWVNKHWAPNHWLKLYRLISWIEKINLKYATYIITVSNVLKEDLIQQGIPEKKILMNPNGVDTDFFNTKSLEASRIKLRKNLNLQNKFVFGFIGTFNQWHGIEVIEKIIIAHTQLKQNSHFILIGDGPLCEQLYKNLKKKQALSYTSFTGILSPQKAREYLASCDTFLSPTQPNNDGSRFFGSPTKLFEYMSLAKPIIASDLEQIAEILSPAACMINAHLNIEPHHRGILIEAKNHSQFIAATHAVINLDSSILKKVGISARKEVSDNYSWLHHVQKIEKFITKKGEINDCSSREN